MRKQPEWWPSDFTPDLVGAAVVGKHYEEAMYLIMAADCEVMFREINREGGQAKPDGRQPYRIQLWVVNSLVTSYQVG